LGFGIYERPRAKTSADVVGEGNKSTKPSRSVQAGVSESESLS
jgi:hypothetical protein